MRLSSGAVAVVVISFIFCPLAILALVCRLWSRRMMQLKLCSNDFTVILAMVLTVGTTAVFLAEAFAGDLGVHLKDVPQNVLLRNLKLFVPAQLMWAASNTCIKLSILDLYIKIFPNPTFRRMCYFTFAPTIGYFVSVLLEAFLLCRPVSYNWDKSVPGGSCTNTSLAYLLAGITNLLIDAWVVILPTPMLWRLHLPFAKKLELAGMFGLGFIICVISLQRVLWLKHWDLTDLTYGATPGACWSILEPTLGVVNACLPTMRPSLRKIFNKDVLAWPKVNRNYLTMDRQSKQNSDESSNFPTNSDKIDSLRLKELQNPFSKPQIIADYRAISDNRMRLDHAKPDSNAIQVTRTWNIETMKDGSHHV